MSEYIITDEQLQKDHEQFYEAGQRNRQVWTARVYHGQEIVRCRDCVGLYETWDGWECERFSGEYHRAEPDGFCSWSCRRSDKE